MGMFDFMKDAGDDVTATVEVAPDRVNELRQQNITRSLAQLDIDGEQVDVSVNGEAVVLTGTAPSQEAMEKMVLCAGNQHGIGQVDCRVEVVAPAVSAASPASDASAAAAPAAVAPEATEASTFYTVQSGDTLGKIAAAHYGNAGKYTVIFEANQPMLSDPDKIYPGQSLRIPPL
jgi:nucleoid-associated protein YgaU